MYSVGVRQTANEHIGKQRKLFQRLFKTAHTLFAVFQPARGPMESQNVSFLPIFYGITIRFHFSSGVSARAGPQVKSERIVFAYFLWVYDTFSLFRQCFYLCGASCRVRTYRFCPFFMSLRYVFTFPAAFQPARSLKRSHNVSFLSIFHGITIRFHFFGSSFYLRGASCEVWAVRATIYQRPDCSVRSIIFCCTSGSRSTKYAE